MNYLKNIQGSTYIFFIFILAGIGLRLKGLGQYSFWTDELYHVIAAKSLLEMGIPFVPEAGEYYRAYPITKITAFLFKHFGESETIARLPFVFINIAFISTSYYILKKNFNAYLALTFAFVMTFSPFEIMMSRECRMYTLLQFFYFIGSITFILGFESKKELINSEHQNNLALKIESKYGINIKLLAISLILFYISKIFHNLTLCFSITLILYLSIMAIKILIGDNIKTAIQSKYFIILSFIFIVLLFLILIDKNFIEKALTVSNKIPVWAKYTKSDYNYYRYFLTNDYPAFVFLYTIGCYYLIKNYGRIGFFIFLCFFPLIIIHTFLFGRKLDRYIFYIFPFFILAASYFISEILPTCIQRIKHELSGHKIITAFLICLIFLPAINVVGYPWLGNSKNVASKARYPDWKSIQSELMTATGGTIITSRIKEVLYYSGRMPDFLLVNNYKLRNDDGISPIRDSSKLEQILSTKNDVTIIIPRYDYKNSAYMDSNTHKTIEMNCDKKQHDGDPRILIFSCN